MDPLRPLTTLLRSLRKTGKSKSAQQGESASTGEIDASTPLQHAAPVRAASTVPSRLQAALASQTPWNPERARMLFVECILVDELGDQISRDPAFHDMVRKVSEQLASVPALNARLELLLKDLSVGRKTP